MSTLTKVALALTGAAGLGGVAYLLRDQTTDSDATGVDYAPPPPVPRSTSIGVRAVGVLNRLVGTKGLGPKGTPGYHRGPVIDQILRGLHDDAPKLIGKAWCARAIRFAFESAAQELGMPPPFPKKLGTLAIVGTWMAKPFDAYKISSPKVGAVLLLGKRHSTLIAKVINDKNVVTVEGNHGDRIGNFERVLKDEDTIVDVEAWINAQKTSSPRIVGALHMLGATREEA
jgi:hypothetical protein